MYNLEGGREGGGEAYLGIFPVSELRPSRRPYVAVVRSVSSLVVYVPVKSDHRPSCVGMVPLKLLRRRLKPAVRSVHFPSSVGSVRLNELLPPLKERTMGMFPTCVLEVSGERFVKRAARSLIFSFASYSCSIIYYSREGARESGAVYVHIHRELGKLPDLRRQGLAELVAVQV